MPRKGLQLHDGQTGGIDPVTRAAPRRVHRTPGIPRCRDFLVLSRLASSSSRPLVLLHPLVLRSLRRLSSYAPQTEGFTARRPLPEFISPRPSWCTCKKDTREILIGYLGDRRRW